MDDNYQKQKDKDYYYRQKQKLRDAEYSGDQDKIDHYTSKVGMYKRDYTRTYGETPSGTPKSDGCRIS